MIRELLDDIGVATNLQRDISNGINDNLSALPHINRKSITRGANDATFQFPILCSNTIPLDMASTIARTMERVYAGFTQQWISLNPQIDLSRDRNATEYLKKFHSNIKLENVNPDENSIYDNYTAVYTNADYNMAFIFNESSVPYAKSSTDTQISKYNTSRVKLYKEDISEKDIVDSIINTSANKVVQNRQKLQADIYSKSNAPRILDKDVKKSNDLLPYQMEVRLIGVNGDKEFVQYIDFILGIKAILHVVKTDDLITNCSNAVKNKNAFFKFLRWTSGEISLVKSILFNITDVKRDAISISNGGNKWFPTLRRLRDKRAKINPRTMTINSILPNSTIVMTQYECEQVLNATGVDLRFAKYGKMLMNQLFLLALIIVDDSTGTLDVLFDSYSDYQTYNLDVLERETSLSSNKIGKEIGRMLSK